MPKKAESMIFKMSAGQDEVQNIATAPMCRHLSEDEFKNFGNFETLMHGRRVVTTGRP